jgi:hypothetical protein
MFSHAIETKLTHATKIHLKIEEIFEFLPNPWSITSVLSHKNILARLISIHPLVSSFLKPIFLTPCIII